MYNPGKYLLFLFLFLLYPRVNAQFYNGAFQEYGKNRVQYNVFEWKYLDFQRFRIYYYAGGKELAVYTAKAIEKNMNELEVLLDYKVRDKLEFIVYNKQSHFRQSNIGVDLVGDYNIGGVSNIVGDKLFVYFESDKHVFEQQIRGTLAQLILYQVAHESNWRDIIRANNSINLPEWYTQGFISFISKGWNPEIESLVKDAVLTDALDNFNDFTDPDILTIGGHALWYYIQQIYGKDVISVLLYMSRVSDNIPRSFSYVLGVSYERLIDNMNRFYKSRFYDDVKHQQQISGEEVVFKKRRNRDYYGFTLSPDRVHLAYVENHYGRYKVKILDLLSGKERTIFKAEPKLERIMDHSFPVLGWHPSGEGLAFFNEYKGNLNLNIYTLADKEMSTVSMRDIEKVLSFDYAPDGKTMVLSATRRGQTNLYLYKIIGSSYQPITDDFYDDLHPKFIDGGNRIIFASNRSSDSIERRVENNIYTDNKDIFIFDLKQLNRPRKTLTRLTDSPESDESFPVQINNNKYVYLSDRNGLVNRYSGMRDSVISSIDTTINYRYFNKEYPYTNYVSSILKQEYNANANELIEVFYVNNQTKVYKVQLPEKPPHENIKNTSFKVKYEASKSKEVQKKETTAVKIKSTENIEKETLSGQENENNEVFDVDKVDINDYQFIPDTLKEKEEKQYEKEIIVIGKDGGITSNEMFSDTSAKKKVVEFEMPGERLYKINFAKDYSSTQFDNNFLNQSYQRYTGPGSVYFNPGLNALSSVSISDLFENIKLFGAMRLPFLFNSSEYLGIVDYLNNKVNHRLILYRQAYSDNFSTPTGFNNDFKVRTHEVRYRLTYPFSEVMSIRGTIGYRNDLRVTPAYDDATLIDPNRYFNNATLKGEWIYDSAIPMGLNLWRGCKLKIFGEMLQEIDNERASTYIVGADFRHSLRLKRKIIWVNRLSASTSFGQKKLLYYMGAVDSWILRRNPAFDANIQVDPSEPYAYQTVATPMRGFIQNARNGTSFVLLNTELRVPFVSLTSPNKSLSEFAQNFQIVFFGDVGTAWNGPHPYSPLNFFNTQTIVDYPIIISLFNQREPIIGGFGVGFRARLSGYFLKLDVAWGVEDGIINSPILYLSLAFDI